MSQYNIYNRFSSARANDGTLARPKEGEVKDEDSISPRASKVDVFFRLLKKKKKKKWHEPTDVLTCGLTEDGEFSVGDKLHDKIAICYCGLCRSGAIRRCTIENTNMSISVHCSFRLSDLDKGTKAPHSVYFWIVFFIIASGTAASATLFSAVPNCVTQCTPTLCSFIFIFGQVGGECVRLESRPLVSSKRRHLFPQSSYSCFIFFCLHRLTAFHCGFWFYPCTLGDMKGVLSIKHVKKKHNVLDLYRYLIMRRPKRSQKPSFSRTIRTGGGGGDLHVCGQSCPEGPQWLF